MSHEHRRRLNIELHNPYTSPREMETVASPIRRPAPRLPLWTVLAAVVGFVIGAGSRNVRPMISGTVHYESIVSGILLVLFSILIAVRFSASRGQRQSVSVVVLVALSWATYATGWLLVHGRFWDDLIFAAFLGAGVSSVIALFALSVSRLLRG